jgi:hypothetical protein
MDDGRPRKPAQPAVLQHGRDLGLDELRRSQDGQLLDLIFVRQVARHRGFAQPAQQFHWQGSPPSQRHFTFCLMPKRISVGLLAHSLEQLSVAQVIRPRGRYVGPMPESLPGQLPGSAS